MHCKTFRFFLFICMFCTFFACSESYADENCTPACSGSSSLVPESQKPRSVFSISGRVVQCVKETLNVLFFSPECHDNQANLLPALQSKLKDVIYLMMILYVVLFGIKLTISPQELNKREFFTLILKLSLVFYFSVGVTYQGKTQDGLVDIVYKGGLSAMESFSGFVLNGAINNGLCEFTSSDYSPGYSYLALWDSLDCRVAYYLGMGGLFVGLDPTEIIAFGVLEVIFPLILGLYIVESLIIIVFGVLFLSLVIFFVHFYIISMIGLTVTVYLGVIMVPLSLFRYTKQFFDKWVTLVFSYVIQPCVIVAMCALMLMVMDQVIYPGCEFEQTAGTYAWTMQSNESSECKNSLGGSLYNTLINKDSGPVIQAFDVFFFQAVVIGNGSYWKSLMPAFMKMIFFCYLFLMFAEGAGELAAQLTNGPNLGKLATNAAAAFNKFLDKLSQRPKDKEKGEGKSGGSGVSVQGKTSRPNVKVNSK